MWRIVAMMISALIGFSVSGQTLPSFESFGSIACSFHQVKRMAILDEPLVSDGLMFYEDGKLRWEYLTPESHIFLMDGKQSATVFAGKVHRMDLAHDKKFSKIKSLMELGVDLAAVEKNGKFSVSCKEEKSGWRLVLFPVEKSLARMIREVRLHVSRDLEVVDEVEIIDHSENQTQIIFTDIRKDEKVPDEKFSMLWN